MNEKMAILIGNVLAGVAAGLFNRAANGEELKDVLTLKDLVDTKVLSELIRYQEEEKAKKELK